MVSSDHACSQAYDNPCKKPALKISFELTVSVCPSHEISQLIAQSHVIPGIYIVRYTLAMCSLSLVLSLVSLVLSLVSLVVWQVTQAYPQNQGFRHTRTHTHTHTHTYTELASPAALGQVILVHTTIMEGRLHACRCLCVQCTWAPSLYQARLPVLRA